MNGPDELLARKHLLDDIDALRASPHLWYALNGATRAIILRCRGEVAANAALAARCGELQAAIDELVACKNLRDIIDDHADDYHRAPATDALQEEYERRKPLAWAVARALASQVETKDG